LFETYCARGRHPVGEREKKTNNYVFETKVKVLR